MAASFAERLLAWFDREKRDLPWRRCRDPWAIWVSEVMLQQTRAEAVREPYVRFMRDYPTPASFARASDDELLSAWRGLGYYRRARLLRDGARQVAERHGGRVPETSRELGELRGVGRYTMGAIASIAFGEALPAVDGNVERVAARHAGIRDDVKRDPAARQIREWALDRMDRARAGDFNQALMELGATACTPRNPNCGACPVSTDCIAATERLTHVLPVLPRRRPTVGVSARMALVERGDSRIVAMRLPDIGPNAGQLELPGPGVLVDCPTPGDLEAALLAAARLRASVGPELATARHSITHHRISLTLHAVHVRGRIPSALVAADPADVGLPWSTASRKVLRKIGRC